MAKFRENRPMTSNSRWRAPTPLNVCSKHGFW